MLEVGTVWPAWTGGGWGADFRFEAAVLHGLDLIHLLQELFPPEFSVVHQAIMSSH